MKSQRFFFSDSLFTLAFAAAALGATAVPAAGQSGAIAPPATINTPPRQAKRRQAEEDEHPATGVEEVLGRQRDSVDDPGLSFAADAEFHRLIVELSGSETLQVLAGMVTNIIREGDRSYAESHDWEHERELGKIAFRAHTRLLELIRKRSGEEAEELWRKHLAESAKIVLGDRATATVVELLS